MNFVFLNLGISQFTYENIKNNIDLYKSYTNNCHIHCSNMTLLNQEIPEDSELRSIQFRISSYAFDLLNIYQNTGNLYFPYEGIKLFLKGRDDLIFKKCLCDFIRIYKNNLLRIYNEFEQLLKIEKEIIYKLKNEYFIKHAEVLFDIASDFVKNFKSFELQINSLIDLVSDEGPAPLIVY